MVTFWWMSPGSQRSSRSLFWAKCMTTALVAACYSLHKMQPGPGCPPASAGDIEQHLRDPVSGPSPPDPTAFNMSQLMPVDWPVQELVSEIGMLGDMPFSPDVTEEAYTAVAIAMRLHNRFGGERMTSLSVLALARPAVAISDEGRRLQEAKDTLMRLEQNHQGRSERNRAALANSRRLRRSAARPAFTRTSTVARRWPRIMATSGTPLASELAQLAMRQSPNTRRHRGRHRSRRWQVSGSISMHASGDRESRSRPTAEAGSGRARVLEHRAHCGALGADAMDAARCVRT